MAKKKPTFEEALTRLEAIAEQIEQGKIGLEESITRYEEGMELIAHCRQILGRAEQRVQELHEKADGSPELKPHEGDRADSVEDESDS